jgi:NAD(P)-dependent dehydrogenase (short-subunit alcohol dehydrogenase family)
MDKLKEKVALITGGTTGIGRASAQLFAGEGARVTVTSNDPHTLELARSELRGIAEVVASDAGSSADIERLARDVRAGGKGLDVLFLNAGIAKFGSIAELPETTFAESFRVNAFGPWLALKNLAPLMRSGGAIVASTAIADELGMPGSSAVAASKAALRALVRVAANELAGAGIRVNAVSYGLIDTPLLDKVQGLLQDLTARIPMKRIGTADEAAKAVLFLASDDSSYMTGEEIVVDGGMTRV